MVLPQSCAAPGVDALLAPGCTAVLWHLCSPSPSVASLPSLPPLWNHCPLFPPVESLPSLLPVESLPSFFPVESLPSFLSVASLPSFFPVASLYSFFPVASLYSFFPVESLPSFLPVESAHSNALPFSRAAVHLQNSTSEQYKGWRAMPRVDLLLLLCTTQIGTQ